MTAAPAAARRPVLAIVHGDTSVSAMKLAAAAEPVCDLVWLVDSSEKLEASMIRLLRRFGTTIDVVGMSGDEVAEALRPCRPDGIVAYADPEIPLASAVADRLGLDYHDEVAVGRLVDKLSQRQALRDGGLPVPRCIAVPLHPTPEDADAVAAGVAFPVVLKPRHGAGSRDTVLVRDAGQLRALLAGSPPRADADEPSMVVEEYLEGMAPPSPDFADYVSVESLVTAGRISHVAVTGRFPPAEPFREGGFFIPSALDTAAATAVLDVATRAIAALGVHTGFLHTEIKLTPGGPRVIEVNGRLGGGIPEMLALASGVELFEVSQRVALGERIVFEELVPTDRVGYLMYMQPPQWARRMVSVDGLDRLGTYPGVDTVLLNRRPGDALDWREGNRGHVVSVLGAAPDHQALASLRRLVDEEVTITYA